MIQLGVMNEMMEEVIGELEVELDGRFSSIRNNETNLGKHTLFFISYYGNVSIYLVP